MRKAFIFLVILNIPTMLWADSDREVLFEIETSEISERSLFGGLGSSTGPIGEVTEFFVPELTAPLIDIGGLHANAFQGNKIFVIKKLKYFICPQPTNDELCYECPNCSQQNKFQDLQRFDIKNRDKTRKKEVRKFRLPTMIDQGRNSIVEFQIPTKNSQEKINSSSSASPASSALQNQKQISLSYPLSVSAKYTSYGKGHEPLKQFQYTQSLSILKSDDDPNFYLCPTSIYSSGCYVCIDCERQLDQIKTHPAN